MWKEYAIEPVCLVQSRESFRFLYSLFGSEQGRWIAKFPSKWKEQVKQALETSPLRDVERGRVIEWLRVGRFFGVGPENYDARVDWLTNAISHHEGRPFAKILATANPATHADVVIPDSEDNLGDCLACPHQVSVQRTAGEITQAVSPLLQKASSLFLIDPHFDPIPRFLSVLEAILLELRQRQQKPERIEYHFSYDALCERLQKLGCSHEYFRRRVKDTIEPLLPPGHSINLFAWISRPGGEKLHDRFILAPIGGVNVSVGLDTGEPGQTTLVTRLGAAAHDKIWAAYQHGKPTAAFDLAPSFPIKLTRP